MRVIGLLIDKKNRFFLGSSPTYLSPLGSTRGFPWSFIAPFYRIKYDYWLIGCICRWTFNVLFQKLIDYEKPRTEDLMWVIPIVINETKPDVGLIVIL